MTIGLLRAFSGKGLLLPLILGQKPRHSFESCDFCLVMMVIALNFCGFIARINNSSTGSTSSVANNNNRSSKAATNASDPSSNFVQRVWMPIWTTLLWGAYSIVKGNALAKAYSLTVLIELYEQKNHSNI